MKNNNTDPTPAPPLEGRGSATAGEVNPQGTAPPLEGRESATAGEVNPQGTPLTYKGGERLRIDFYSNFGVLGLFKVDSVINGTRRYEDTKFFVLVK